MSEIKVLVKKPHEAPFKVVIREATALEDLQKLVGGYIEFVPVAESAAIICDEEGRLKGKKYNCDVCGISFVGTIVVVGMNGEGFGDAPDLEEFLDMLEDY